MKCPKCDAENTQDSQFCKKCATSLTGSEKAQPSITKTIETPREELTTGSTFAQRYQIIEELGKGGMGRVYKVLDKETKERIALKLIKPDIASDKKTIERFKNELTTARKIRHKNVCGMYYLGEDQSRPYITMEFVSGEDLKSSIRRFGHLPTGKAITITKQICEGLIEAHSLGVVHRDLKPNNIMIDDKGNARIMDFGIARSLAEKGITGAGVMIGTPEYMSPEQAEAKEIDQRTDIYSLGVILYEMVTGQLPFEGDTPLAVAMKHKGEPPKDPQELNPQIPEDLSRVILRCLEKDKEDRFQNAGDVRSELTGIEKGMPTSDRIIPERIPSTSKEITVTFRRRWLLIPLLFVVLVAALLAFLFLKKGNPTAPSPKQNILVVLPFENLGREEDEYFADGIAEEISSRLAALHELGVISRSSAMRYKQSEKTIKEIGEELGVDFIIDGTVRWDRNPEGRGRVRVTPELIRVSDDIRIWSNRYDRDIEDIFAVQSDIAEQVIRELNITLLEPEQQALKAKPTDNLEAYQAYLRGIAYTNRTDRAEEGFRLEIQMYERSIELDPDFALAYVGLSEARSHLSNPSFRYDLTEDNILKAKAAADRALELQPELPEGHRALGLYYYLCHQDYDRALDELSIAEKGLPNNSRITEYVGYIQRRQGNFEGSIINTKKAIELNPQDAHLPQDLANTLRRLRRYQEAVHYFDRSISLDPDSMGAYRMKASTYMQQGLLGKARTTLENLPRKSDPPSIRNWHRLWAELEILERNYQAALEHLSSDLVVSFGGSGDLFSTGLIYRFMDRPKLAHNSFDAARVLLEKQVKEQPDIPDTHSRLGIAYAGFGRKEEAIREGKLAVELYPVSKDTYLGPIYVDRLAKIYVLVGEYEEALDKIEYLLSIPTRYASVQLLQLHPIWDPLRELPRFKHLLEKYANED
ncbi:protein kinase [Acidobacteriota bacterium]